MNTKLTFPFSLHQLHPGRGVAAAALTLLAVACAAQEGEQTQYSAAHNCVPSPEVCDGIDNDCSGIADDNTPGCDVCATRLQLPVPTNFNRVTNQPQAGAADQAAVFAPHDSNTPYAPGCYPVYADGRTPDYAAYIGDTWSITQIPNDRAITHFGDLCRATQTPFRFFPANKAHEVVSANAGAVQVIHGVEIDGALATIVLPANWTKETPAGGYPIFANGYYDLNDAVFSQLGSQLLTVIADSSRHNSTGAIGVFWNGGGAAGSATLASRAQDQFASLVAHVAANYGGNAQKIIMFGNSRGAGTALTMAANPKHHPYRVTFVAAAVPPTLVGEHANLISTTMPALMALASWITGFQDAWRANWRYPACANKPHLTGKTAAEAMLHILTGSSDAHIVNTERSLQSDAFINGLRDAGTQVHLQVGSHDAYIPYAHQVGYGVKLFSAGVPIEAIVMIRGGHFALNTTGVAATALQAYIRPERAGSAPTVTPGITYYRVNRQSPHTNPELKLETFTPDAGLFPFTLEAPRFTYPGARFPMMMVGHPGTEWEVTVRNDAIGPFTWTGVIGGLFSSTQWVDVPTNLTATTLRYEVRIRKPNQQEWITINRFNTIDGTEAFISVLPSETSVPNYGWFDVGNFGWGTNGAPAGGKVPGLDGTSWGLSEY